MVQANRSRLLPPQRVSYDDVIAYLAAKTEAPSSLGAQLERMKQRATPDATIMAERAGRRRMATQGVPVERHREALARDAEHRLWNTVKVSEEQPNPAKDCNSAVIEGRLLNHARVINCVRALADYGVIRFAECPDVAKFAKAADVKQGGVVIGAMRAYEEWRLQSQERGLAGVYLWMREWNPSLPIAAHDESDDAQAFRVGKAKNARKRASALVADAIVVIHEWIEIWNRRQVTRASAA